MTELTLSIVAVVVGFALLVWGADRFVHGASAAARNLGVSPLIIGLTIVGFGTSAPEMLVSIVSALEGNPGLAVGNALGSNITNIGMVLGLTALITPLVVKSETLRREYPAMFAVMLLTLALMIDGQLDRIDGVILLCGLGLMVYWMVMLGLRKSRRDPMEYEYAQEIPLITTQRALLWLLAGFLVLLFSSRILVWGSVNIAQSLGVSDVVIGLTIVAIGTSLPELAASVMSALKKEPDIAIGNVIGSNMFNLLGVLGIPAIIAPMPLEQGILSRDYSFMIGLSIALFVMAYGFRNNSQLNRFEGGLLLLTYVAYIAVLYYSIKG